MASDEQPDVKCPVCEYSLKGLADDDVVCPECGGNWSVSKLCAEAKRASPEETAPFEVIAGPLLLIERAGGAGAEVLLVALFIVFVISGFNIWVLAVEAAVLLVVWIWAIRKACQHYGVAGLQMVGLLYLDLTFLAGGGLSLCTSFRRLLERSLWASLVFFVAGSACLVMHFFIRRRIRAWCLRMHLARSGGADQSLRKKDSISPPAARV